MKKAYKPVRSESWEERFELAWGISPKGTAKYRRGQYIKHFISLEIELAREEATKTAYKKIGLDLDKKCVIFIDNHHFVNRVCKDCGLCISEETSAKIDKKNLELLK